MSDLGRHLVDRPARSDLLGLFVTIVVTIVVIIAEDSCHG